MKTLKQLLRQPLKTLTGLVLMTLAAAILCLCVGQALAAYTTKQDLDNRFSTVAIPSLQENLTEADQFRVEQELLAWLEKTAQEHPDILQGRTPNGLLSAYIPQLLPYNIQSQDNVSNYGVFGEENSLADATYFDSAMLVITLDEIGPTSTPMDAYAFEQAMPNLGQMNTESAISFLQMEQYKAYRNHQDYQIYQDYIEHILQRTHTDGCTVELTGTIMQTLSVPSGMRDPVGMTARLKLTLPSQQDIEDLGLVPGQQYIVYGMDYFDEYQFIVEYLKQSSFKHITFAPFDPAKVKTPTEDEVRSYLQNKKINPVALYNYVPLEQWQFSRFNSVSMTLCAPINLIPYENVLNDAAEVVDRIPQSEVTYSDRNGNTYTIPMAQYNAKYAVPTIAHLNGSAQDFLASQDGMLWQAALDQTQVNDHAFPVVGVEDLHQLPCFALDKAKMGDGREFTAEEVENGAKVCIMHELVAQNSGLQLGDTITIRFYITDYANPYQLINASNKSLLRPAASLYFSTTPFVETAEYTIVGFWQGSPWPDSEEYYQFSANTVFVPRSSVECPMETVDSIAMITVGLENGMIRPFHELVKRSGYAGRFKYSDQGYEDIASNFHNYEALAQQIMAVGVVLYAILLLLFLLLYPATQGKTVWTMASLGCGFGKCFGHVLLSSMIILTVSSALGGLAGTMLWDRVVAVLQATTESSVALQLQSGVLGMVAAAQLVLALLLSALVAIWVAIPRGLSARR